MMSSLSIRRVLGAVVALTLSAGFLLAGAVPAASDADPATCNGATTNVAFPGGIFAGRSSRVSSDGAQGIPQIRTYALAQPLAAGTYSLDAVSYDGYVGRSRVTQTIERWFVELVGADGEVLATSAPTDDLPDRIEEVTGQFDLGTVTWSDGEAVEIRTVHTDLGTPGINSVDPVCVGFTLVPPPDPPSSPPPGDAEPPADDGSGPIAEPPIDTDVGGIVQLPVAPPAAPQVADPTFTG